MIVAASTETDTLAGFSNYGNQTVHLAAPGEKIYSTGHNTSVPYLHKQGTSMAAPHVTGALALMMARFPAYTYQQLIQKLLDNSDNIPALNNYVMNGRRLNLEKAIDPPLIMF
ncbi:MAG: hypothetical protein A3F67_09875 [Verrucomicrobia bacterium RIFCSPHIGHO2_12_FULL_41_10]|nr:MAG: hypothetical protein A3F67_09875 [Verrucomicrobia bacterium RIFCSPHIGHO2_12_FULL_41_10]